MYGAGGQSISDERPGNSWLFTVSPIQRLGNAI